MRIVRPLFVLPAAVFGQIGARYDSQASPRGVRRRTRLPHHPPDSLKSLSSPGTA
jgi:hypothetical protein